MSVITMASEPIQLAARSQAKHFSSSPRAPHLGRLHHAIHLLLRRELRPHRRPLRHRGRQLGGLLRRPAAALREGQGCVVGLLALLRARLAAILSAP